MSSALSANGLLACVTILNASRRISAILLRRANNGASGNAATNNVTNPYWSTGQKTRRYYFKIFGLLLTDWWNNYSFLNILQKVPFCPDLAGGNPPPMPYANAFRRLFVSCAFFDATNSKTYCCKTEKNISLYRIGQLRTTCDWWINLTETNTPWNYSKLVFQP